MGEEHFYDNEDIARSWTELHTSLDVGHKTETQYAELLQAVRWMLPRLMEHMSQEMWAAGWLEGLDEILPKEFPAIDVAAKHLGSICTYWDSRDDNEGVWRDYQ